MNAHPARTFSSNRQKAAAEAKAKAEAEFEGRLKERNDGSYEAFRRLSDSERQSVLISESEAYRNADTEAKNWGVGGSKSRAVNAGTILLTGILGGKTNLQTAANTLSPYAAAAIGNTFGHGANQNETAQLAGHFLLGATLAYINGGDPLSGGGAAVAAEKAAQYLSQQYNDGQTAIDPQTGEFNPNLLPEQIKDEIKSTTGVIAAIVGATGDGGAALNAQIGGVLGQNAVENNSALARYQKRVNLYENIADITDPFGILTPLYDIKKALGDLNKLKEESRRKDQDKINQNIKEYLEKHGIKINLNTAYEEVNGQGVIRLDTEGNRKVLTKALQEFAQASATTHATFRAEKMRLGIPTTMQPTAVRRVPLMEKDYITGKEKFKEDMLGNKIYATEYLFITNGKNYVIQNHSSGHDFGEPSGRGNQAAHFNSKQLELTTYTVSGKVNADVWKQEKDMPHNQQTYTSSKIIGVTEHRYTKPSVNAKPSEPFFKKTPLKQK